MYDIISIEISHIYIYIYHSWICKAPKLHETWYCLLGATIGFRWILEDINGLSKSTLGGGFNGILVQQNFRDLPYLSICWKTKSEPTLQHLQIYVPSGKLYNIAMEYHYLFTGKSSINGHVQEFKNYMAMLNYQRDTNIHIFVYICIVYIYMYCIYIYIYMYCIYIYVLYLYIYICIVYIYIYVYICMYIYI